MWKLFIISISSLILFSCVKEKAIELTYTEIKLPTELDLNDIYVENDSSIWIAAGKRFGRGAVFYSPDFGNSWNILLDNDFEIRSLRFINNRIYAVSIGNTLHWSDDRGQNWSTLTMPGWDYFSAADFFSDNTGLLVGGENFGKGIVNKVNSGSNTAFLDADTIQHELSDIEILNDSLVIAVGYGVILSSIDKGQNWVPDNSRGDFFKAVSFSNSNNGLVVGEYGSIYKTTDSGKNWKKIKGSNTFFNNKNRYTDIFYFDNNFAVISGKNGLLMKSINAGQSWSTIKNLPKVDFISVHISGDFIFATSNIGKLYIILNS